MGESGVDAGENGAISGESEILESYGRASVNTTSFLGVLLILARESL